MTETTITLTAAERDLIGRALSDRMSICLATREEAERNAATRMLMRLQGLNIKPDHVRDAAPAMLTALKSAEPFIRSGDVDSRGGKIELSRLANIMAAAIAAAEGREPANAPKVEPAPADFEVRHDGKEALFTPVTSAARQWSIDYMPNFVVPSGGAYRTRFTDNINGLRRMIEAEGFTVREG